MRRAVSRAVAETRYDLHGLEVDRVHTLTPPNGYAEDQQRIHLARMRSEQ